MNRSDLELLRQYAREGCEDAFTLLVNRHIDLVYSTALRLVGQRHLAQDVAQTVFIELARKAQSIRESGAVAGWLYHVARRTAIDMVRKESRRQRRERAAHMQASTTEGENHEAVLERAIETLDDADRSAILLRFFESKSLREVAELMGSSEDAIQKRVSRALEKLRTYLIKRGVSSSPAVVLSAIATQSAQAAAPAGLGATLAAASVAAASGTGTAGLTSTLINTIAMSKTQTALAAILVVSMATLVWQHQANSRLKQQLAAVGTTNSIPAGFIVVEEPAPVASDPVVVTNVVVEPFDWRKVESSDYREYVANLRAIGCPPATIQDIVSADLRKNLRDKLKLPAEKPVRPFWLDDERAAQAAMNEAYVQREELLNQFSASHQQLLGVPPDRATIETFMNSVLEQGMVDSRNALMANWPAELKEEISAIESAHNKRVRESGTINTAGFETSMQRMALEVQRENELAEVLAPAEFGEYLLRESVTARMMRHRLRHFGATEEEFRKIFPLQREFDVQWGPYDARPADPVQSRQYDAAREELLAQIQQVLGSERFEALAARGGSNN